METKVLISLFVLCSSLTLSYGLKCYVCQGDAVLTDAGDCGDPYDTEAEASRNVLTTCAANEMYCKKEKSGVNNAWTRVTRSCASECEDKNTLYVDRTDCCKTDACNSGSALAASILLVVVSASTFFKLM